MRLSCTFHDKDGKEIGKSGDGAYPSSSLLQLRPFLNKLLVRPHTAWQVMNEVALHRGRSPHLVTIDAFVDGQHLTESVVRVLFSRHHTYDSLSTDNHN